MIGTRAPIIPSENAVGEIDIDANMDLMSLMLSL